MPTDESLEPVATGRLTLAVRRPGHAAMSTLISQLDRAGCGDVVPSDLQSWHIGAIGEVLAGQELARLSPEWTVLHAVPVGQVADIDHLVIGPAGVFVLNTKRHPGKTIGVGTHLVWVNGTSVKNYQRDLVDRAAKVGITLGRALDHDLRAQPVLVFVDAQSLRTFGEQRVASVRMAALIRYLESLPRRLDPDQVAALVGLAEQPGTWGRSASVLHEPDPTPRFLRLTTDLPAVERAAPAVSARHETARPSVARRGTDLQGVGPRLIGALLAAIGIPIAALLGVGLFAHLVQALLAR